MNLQRRIISLSCALVCLFFAEQSFAQPDAEFLKGNQDYAAGRFQDAIKSYEALVQSRQFGANLFYNLGNAYFRAGDLGSAILNYERALALDRHHPEADANLRIARDETRALELSPAPIERVLRFASANQFAIAAAIAFWVGTFSVVALVFSRRRAAGLIALSIFALSIFASAGFEAYRLENGTSGKSLAIVTGNGVEARLATADNANTVLALPPGSEIKILSTRGDWIYAALPNHLRGWLPTKSAELVRL
ncbi:MAG: tetratricopeptide repeat protein [Chthoniobacterales bacterium]